MSAVSSPTRQGSLYSSGGKSTTSKLGASGAKKTGTGSKDKDGAKKVTAQDNEGSIDLTTLNGDDPAFNRRDSILPVDP